MRTPATPRLLRRMNAQRVLDILREVGPLRVTELVAQTGLSRPTVDAVADDLVRLGWLEESAAETPRRGRPARSLAFRADAGYVAGRGHRRGQGPRRGRGPRGARSSPSACASSTAPTGCR